MRFHVLGLCHTVSSKEYIACAFTQKVVKFCDMMSQISDADKELKSKMSIDELVQHKTIHYLIHYGHENSEVSADEHVTVTTNETLKRAYGNYDWKKNFFKHSAGDFAHVTFSTNAAVEITKRKRNGDIILCFWGLGHKMVADHFKNDCIIVEPGIGYPVESSFTQFKVYESYAVMNYHYGANKVIHPSWYDCVIPNYFDIIEFDFKKTKGDYYLYLGRIIKEKGVELVLQLAQRMGFRLLIAGQGSLEKDIGYSTLPPNVEYVGYADLNKRKELMSNAKALFLPTFYVEPFGGVTMEAMFSGTPVITTDWGVFNETVLHGVTGYRCRTMDQFEWAVRNIDKIDPQACRDWAVNNYSFERIRPMYEEYFDMLIQIKFNKGFYQENRERTELNWLSKIYPPNAVQSFSLDANKLLIKLRKTLSNKNLPIKLKTSSLSDKKLPIGLKRTKKARLALYTETKWAFGRIANALKKYSKLFDIDIYEWSEPVNSEKIAKIPYDLVYATVWDGCRCLELTQPQIKDKVIFSGHGLVDFTKLKFDPMDKVILNEDLIEKFVVDNQLIEWMKNRKTGFSAVSHELYDLFTRSHQFEPDKQIYLTQCGVDEEIFKPGQSFYNKSTKLRILYTFPKKSINERGYGYDVKRKWLAESIELKFKKAEKYKNLDIEFVYPPDFLPLDQVVNLYQQADIFLCVSHSEGNPLGAFEAGACGLTVISTSVGEMPKFISDGENGFLIDNKDPNQIEIDIIERIVKLYHDRELLEKMKKNMRESVLANWTWKHKIGQWDHFFDQCLKALK